MNSPIETITSRLDNPKKSGNSWLARCPAHADKSPSLSVTEAADGRVLLHCHAGCETEDILAAIGLTLRDLFPESSMNPAARRVYATAKQQVANNELLTHELHIVKIACNRIRAGETLDQVNLARVHLARQRLNAMGVAL